MADGMDHVTYFATATGAVGVRKIDVSSRLNGSLLIEVGDQRLELEKDEVDVLLFLMGARRDR